MVWAASQQQRSELLGQTVNPNNSYLLCAHMSMADEENEQHPSVVTAVSGVLPGQCLASDH